MSRSVLFDTETTGLDPLTGDRVIEIAAHRTDQRPADGAPFPRADPSRPRHSRTRRSASTASPLDHLRGKPRFAEIVDDFWPSSATAPLVAHNAPFDFGFLNAELRADRPARARTRRAWSTRWRWPRRASPACRTAWTRCAAASSIDLSARTTHNALLDCRLLAEVYVELTGGRQRGFLLVEEATQPSSASARLHPRWWSDTASVCTRRGATGGARSVRGKAQESSLASVAPHGSNCVTDGQRNSARACPGLAWRALTPLAKIMRRACSE